MNSEAYSPPPSFHQLQVRNDAHNDVLCDSNKPLERTMQRVHIVLAGERFFGNGPSSWLLRSAENLPPHPDSWRLTPSLSLVSPIQALGRYPLLWQPHSSRRLPIGPSTF